MHCCNINKSRRGDFFWFTISIFLMAALCNREAIIFLPCDFYLSISIFLSSFFFSSPNLGGHRLDLYHIYFYTWRGPSANLECRSEMCCTRLAGNTGRKKVAKNRHLGTIPQLCRAISSQLRHISTLGKNLLSSNMSSTYSHNMANFDPLAAEIDPVVWAPLQISTGFVAKTRNPSWQRYCTASSSGRQPNFAALNRGRYLCSAGRPSRLNSFLRRCDKRLYGKALCGYFDHVLGS